MSADGGPNQSGQRPGQTAATPPPAPPKNNRRRFLIMGSVPLLLLIVGGWLWLSGGRYVSTDNAYVQQNRVTVTAQVSGRIVEAPVRENEAVATGALLFRIDPEPFRIALAGAEASLASARIQVEQYRAAYQQAVAESATSQENADYKKKAFERQQGLLAKGVASQANFDTAENDMRTAQQALSTAQQHVIAARAALGGDPAITTDRHPAVLVAMAKRDQAALDLKNTDVVAPANGIVAQADRLQVGQLVSVSAPVLSLVETGDSWVEANFKETDLANMTAGKSATISLDAYPGKSFKGTVTSIGAGTGAEFSVLPAQNATGNWIKVVQRVPVLVRFSEPLNGLPLRVGLSASVEVDTQSGGAAASPVSP
jgi:membrane fusion protein (multidrug efflux system)